MMHNESETCGFFKWVEDDFKLMEDDLHEVEMEHRIVKKIDAHHDEMKKLLDNTQDLKKIKIEIQNIKIYLFVVFATIVAIVIASKM